MLRDRYYLGYITYRGEELPGRHEPLVDEMLFDRVQAFSVLMLPEYGGECITITSKVFCIADPATRQAWSGG